MSNRVSFICTLISHDIYITDRWSKRHWSSCYNAMFCWECWKVLFLEVASIFQSFQSMSINDIIELFVFVCACVQATEWGSFAWRLGDQVYKGRSSLLCGSQHPNHHFQRPPHWKVLCVRTLFKIMYLVRGNLIIPDSEIQVVKVQTKFMCFMSN